ncbi:MAG TPA: HDIG domain-containing protein [Aquificales bacterium]|nr:HDIG domain-containing protein [Aquificales bacterium]
MRHPKRNKVDNLAGKGFLFSLSFLWSLLITFHLGDWKYLPIFWTFLSLTLLYVEKKVIGYLPKNKKTATTLVLTFSLLILLAKIISVYDPFKLKPFNEAYYLLLVGTSVGILLKTFIRRENIFLILLIVAITLLFAQPDPYTLVGFILGNVVAADLYGRRRDTISEILGVLAGNIVFAAILMGKWIQIAPHKLWELPIIYAISVFTVILLVFGLQKFLDLFPHMYSDEKLEKLANLSNPLIEEMMLRAPGTYHHSVMVSLLSETLARKLGADPLLTRVGAMFHDIGKLINPQYFIENVNGENPHKNLKPEVSASIIKNHVGEGISLAKKYKLPEEIISFIPEHQGTKLIKYFYYKALEENPNLSEEKFRYPGPIPQSRETAIVMIADTVEAMVRALKNPTAEDIKNTVNKALNLLLEEGQLKKVNFSPEELEKIKKLLTELLLSYYHERIRYPEKPKRVRNV